MAGHFSAFSFVDRITELKPGVRARGCFAVAPELPAFPSCLVAEAVGQLAAWAAMARVEFRSRPVAGLVGEMRILGEAAPGQRLDLEAEIETCDPEAVAYAGRACVGGSPVVTMSGCVGPMLSLEDFDSPDAVRRHFETLCGPGAPPGRFGGVAPLPVTVTESADRRTARGRLRVPENAPFFADHFPRRPVLPGTLLLDAQMRLAMRLAGNLPPAGPRFVPLPDRLEDVKLRTFTLPGQIVDLQADVLATAGREVAIAIAAQVEGKRAGTGRVHFVQREAA